MNVITTATWRALLLYNGLPEKFVQHHKDQGYTAIMPKIGNGLNRWVGLSKHFKAAIEAGLDLWAWWYLFGYKGEGRVIGQHADALRVKVIVLDIESHWENNAGWTEAARERKAVQLIADIRAGGFTGDLALCSWWNTDLHPRVPYKVLLSECKYNMPQLYWIGRHSELQATELVNQSLDMYRKVAEFPAAKTIPVLASFGQTYGTYNNWWKTTIPQMRAAFETAKDQGCIGATFYSTDYLLGGAGHETPKIVEVEMLKAIRGMIEVPPLPVDKVKITVEGKPENYEINISP